MNALVGTIAGGFVAYFLAAYLWQVAVNLFAIPRLRRRRIDRSAHSLPAPFPGFEPPVSLLVPAHDVEGTIVEYVRDLLHLDYPEFEVVVVNDGSRDRTLAVLQEAFDLEPFPEAHWRRIRTQALRAIYRSRLDARLRVIDKEHGGRCDSLNVGINASRFPYFCALEPGTILLRDGLRLLAEPFIEDPRTIATRVRVRVANGCTFAEGRLEAAGLPPGVVPLLQEVESLNGFRCGRMGWTSASPAAFGDGTRGAFRKDPVLEAGGYRVDASIPDAELLAQLHRVMSNRRERYAIRFVPEPICWRAAPESLAALRRERTDRQQAIAEAVHRREGLFAAALSSGLSPLALPSLLACYGPLVEVLGYLFFATMFALGVIPGSVLAAFLFLAFALGFAVSASALLAEEVALNPYPRLRQLARLALAAVLENLGYRQLVAVWRLVGLFRWAWGMPPSPGTIPAGDVVKER